MNIQELSVQDIIPHDDNIRSSMNDDGLRELADSIRSNGLLQPLVVSERDGKYVLIAGHRRFAAINMLGQDRVTCSVVVSDSSDFDTVSMLVENTQREDITPIDEAQAYARLNESGWTQTKIAETVGKSVAHVSKRMKLLWLPDALQLAVTEGRMTIQFALELADIPHEFLQRFVDQAKKGATLTYNKWDVERANREAKDADNMARIKEWTDGIDVVKSVTPEMNLEYVRRLDANDLDRYIPAVNEVVKWDGKSSWLQVYTPVVEVPEDELDEYDLWERQCEKIDEAYKRELQEYRDALDVTVARTVNPSWADFDAHFQNGLIALVSEDWQVDQLCTRVFGKDFPESTDYEDAFVRWLKLSPTNRNIAIALAGVLDTASMVDIGIAAGLVPPKRDEYPPEPSINDDDDDENIIDSDVVDEVYPEDEWEDEQYDIGMEE